MYTFKVTYRNKTIVFLFEQKVAKDTLLDYMSTIDTHALITETICETTDILKALFTNTENRLVEKNGKSYLTINKETGDPFPNTTLAQAILRTKTNIMSLCWENNNSSNAEFCEYVKKNLPINNGEQWSKMLDNYLLCLGVATELC